MWRRICLSIPFARPIDETILGTSPAVQRKSKLRNFRFFRLRLRQPLGDVVCLPRCEKCANMCFRVQFIEVLWVWVQHVVLLSFRCESGCVVGSDSSSVGSDFFASYGGVFFTSSGVSFSSLGGVFTLSSSSTSSLCSLIIVSSNSSFESFGVAWLER